MKKKFRSDEILVSKRDVEIFCKEILNPRKPSKRLIEAAEKYKKMLKEYDK